MSFVNNIFGDLQGQALLIDGTEAHDDPVSATFSAMYYDGISFQLITEAVEEDIAVIGTDHVVSGTHTWTFANGDFVAADVGGTIVVTDAVNANNRIAATISSVTNATTVVTTGTQTTETFAAGMHAVLVKPAGSGDWSIEVSNDFCLETPLKPSTEGHWTDITDQFSPAIQGVSAASSQFVQGAPLITAGVRVTFTPSAGFAGVTVIANAKKA